MNNKNMRGSAILLVLGVMTIVLLGALALERTVLFQADMALTRVRVQQQFRLADGILAYGVMLAQDNFDALQERQDQAVTIDAGFWPLGTNVQSYRGVLIFAPQKTNMLVTAQLYDSRSCVKTMYCTVAADGPKKGFRNFRVTNYSE